MDRIGRYKLEAELGRGGCGRVYRAFDPTVGRTVAIKLLITNTDKELLTRFRNEASASGKLHHRNIVTVYDFGEQDGTPYLVMEYLQGEDLHKLSAKGQQLTLIEKNVHHGAGGGRPAPRAPEWHCSSRREARQTSWS